MYVGASSLSPHTLQKQEHSSVVCVCVCVCVWTPLQTGHTALLHTLQTIDHSRASCITTHKYSIVRTTHTPLKTEYSITSIVANVSITHTQHTPIHYVYRDGWNYCKLLESGQSRLQKSGNISLYRLSKTSGTTLAPYREMDLTLRKQGSSGRGML